MQSDTYPNTSPAASVRLARSFPWHSVDIHFDFVAYVACESHAEMDHAVVLPAVLVLEANLYQCL